MVNAEERRRVGAVVIGGGITGLAVAAQLDYHGVPFVLLEQKPQCGGNIVTIRRDGYVVETGPNTGSMSNAEVKELFDYAVGAELETANPAAKRRWVLKGGRFHPLPYNLWSAITTPLFTWRDKVRILGEPFRDAGTDEDETVGALAERRLGRSFVDYAVDPFISGIYAGDPYQLVTRNALPKLYRLERDHGSFIRGTIAKLRRKKSARDRLATGEVFSARDGLDNLVNALVDRVSGHGDVQCGVQKIHIFENKPQPRPRRSEEGVPANDTARWVVAWSGSDGAVRQVETDWIVSTVPMPHLAEVMPYHLRDKAKQIPELEYAPVVEVSLGFDHLPGVDVAAFGGLIPSVEHRKILGVLFPSSCFAGRVPHRDSVLMSVFLGGVRHGDEVLAMSDGEIVQTALAEVKELLGIDPAMKPDLVEVTRHRHAIPQYGTGYDDVRAGVEAFEAENPGIIIAGGVRDGIGLAHRIKQGTDIGVELCSLLGRR